MAKGLNRILGVFTYEPSFPSAPADFFTPFLLGIEEVAQELGYDLLLLTGAAKCSKRKISGNNTRLRLADGCVVLGREFDPRELKQLVAGDYPFVAVGRRDDAGVPVPYIGGDFASGTAAPRARSGPHKHRLCRSRKRRGIHHGPLGWFFWCYRGSATRPAYCRSRSGRHAEL